MGRDKPKAGWRRYWPRLLFVLPFIAMLWVPSYNRLEPELGGIPFFYWYQLLWILIGAAIVVIVYLIETRMARSSAKQDGDIDTTGVPGDIF
ncbi:MAG: DUF3311 domain-containing protein [Methyloceanibacter sp.]|jgi:hypothetical protein